MSISVRAFDVVRVRDHDRAADRDRVAVELALEVRLNSEPFSVIMRTPGDDRHLALGFLLSESVVTSLDEIERVDLDEVENVINVWIAPDRVAGVLGQRRQVAMNSSCGMCGRRSLESLDVNAKPFAVDWHVREDVVLSLPAVLGQAQSAFAETGGLHAAGLFNLDGVLEASAEDVGRHNAVDKLVGRMLSERRVPCARSILMVSGRSSFEIVQKAYLAGIRMIAAVSAPSSLAIDLAREAGMTLLGFVREHRFNIYAGADRIAR